MQDAAAHAWLSPMPMLDLLSFIPGIFEILLSLAAATAVAASATAAAATATAAAATAAIPELLPSAAAWMPESMQGMAAAFAGICAWGAGVAAHAAAACGTILPAWQLDFRWFRIFRALRLLRLCLLTGNLPHMKLSKGALLSGSTNVRLMQVRPRQWSCKAVVLV